ncbi:hypothetical protein SynPROS71_02667 [Synechococcus sp. PROS-7-1]|nr:hypothetical protein [Synechococcus sp. PROS-7-1]QNI86421.1 hypothetical protein SynPROS71_02667 [Synechococcus sp. PROS-7-1]
MVWLLVRMVLIPLEGRPELLCTLPLVSTSGSLPSPGSRLARRWY